MLTGHILLRGNEAGGSTMTNDDKFAAVSFAPDDAPHVPIPHEPELPRPYTPRPSPKLKRMKWEFVEFAALILIYALIITWLVTTPASGEKSYYNELLSGKVTKVAEQPASAESGAAENSG